MSTASKTGLIPTQRKLSKPFRKKKASNNVLPTEAVAKSIAFSMRPFGGLYNPYSKGCSILCNHPASSAVRTIIRKVKDSWSSEGKIYWQQKDKFEVDQEDLTGHIPEDLFRRYTDTDSRPLTPSPTTASVHTRTSVGSFLNARRCVTPEPGKEGMNKRKKIILDLRRSHSQDTLYWKAVSEISQGKAIDTLTSTDYHETNISKKQKTEDHKSKKNSAHEEQTFAETKISVVCINEKDIEDNDVMQRRGKRRKKGKQAVTRTFHISQDPETQVSALGPDSLSASTRPSLVPNTFSKILNSDVCSQNPPNQLENSFLTEEAFQALKTQLSIDVIENTFERYLNTALREAIKYVSRKKDMCTAETTSIPNEFNKMPRKFSKSATRFEIPLNLSYLEGLSVYDYLSKYVWVSSQRKQLYKKTFLKYLSQEEHTEIDISKPIPLKERTIPVANFNNALEEVLGFYGTNDLIKKISDLLNMNQKQEINFRSWCGIVAIAERFALSEPAATDSSDELEKADFDTLEQRMDALKLTHHLRIVLDVVRQGHKQSQLTL